MTTRTATTGTTTIKPAKGSPTGVAAVPRVARGFSINAGGHLLGRAVITILICPDDDCYLRERRPAGGHTAAMVLVRTAAATDAGAIAGLITQLGYPCSGDDAAARLGYWLTDPMSRVLVAERDDLVIGCLSLHAVPYLERSGRWARIESLVIDESARGTGAGSALLQAAEKVARGWGCLAMEVTSARTREEAHAFYQRMGYSDVCSRSGRFLKEFD